ncbi:MAG TPA: alkaline phosphatase family protein, partial [Longimicrobium sp.]|nr:alkaline phosphatase family protein [Longimicrobium sp.]
MLSILPSTTYAAWASVFTGEPPARTGVPGNEWFAREEMRFYAPAPVTVTQNEHALEVYSDQLMGRVLRAPTV